ELARAAALRGVPSPAAERGRLARFPRPLRQPAVLAALANREEFGATELETFASDPGQWFVERALSPRPLGPDPPAIINGSLAHDVLEKLYREQPGGSARPNPDTLAAWASRLAELVEQVVAERRTRDRARSGADGGGRAGARGGGAGGADARERVDHRRIERYLWRFLRYESTTRAERLEPRHLEASFGSGEWCERPPLELDGWRLSGKIDRIDLDPTGRMALIQDYKFGTKQLPQARFGAEGALQAPLYAEAARHLWGLEPLAALYLPLRAGDLKPRGMAVAGEDAGDELTGLDITRTDRVEPDEFEGLIADARERADRAVTELRAGRIDRPPLDSAYKPGAAAAAIHRRYPARFTNPENGDES
ncbi:MAG TPA: PD-(D/E)XK nuclease family protein, partial [Solirubrobacterales bacterium]|nr:PD-(D/E)XK nuclease family protein [Solirubrobacterales bacterium]